MKRKAGVILQILCPILLFFASACLDDPVGEDYYNNLNLIKGKTRPQAPCIRQTTEPDMTCEYTVQFDIGCLKDVDGTPDDESDDECVYTEADCEYDSDGDALDYYLYVSSTNPDTITDFDYYSNLYLWMQLYLGVPNPNNKVTSSSDNTFYFWAVSWDGGRLSNHSNVEPVIFPSATVCP